MHRLISKLPYRGEPRWIKLDPFAPNFLPSHACCYVIQLDGKTIYVGQTLNLRDRFYSHTLHRQHPREQITLKVKFGQRYGDWAMREARLVERLKPILNVRTV